MKSERAKQYIDNDTIAFRNGDRMVDASTAYIAVELANGLANQPVTICNGLAYNKSTEL